MMEKEPIVDSWERYFCFIRLIINHIETVKYNKPLRSQGVEIELFLTKLTAAAAVTRSVTKEAERVVCQDFFHLHSDLDKKY